MVDRAIGCLGLLVALPFLSGLAILVRWRMGSPVLFRQERAGLYGQPFSIVKLRTMVDGRGPDGHPLPDEARLTPLGRFLRSTSLDELPEIWNVVRGEMVLVGPRPLPTSYLDRYTAEERRRHDVRPGITGWAQVNGRNTTSWDERLAMDVWYVDNRSVTLDLRILARTVLVVLGRQGISADDHVTMPELRAPETSS